MSLRGRRSNATTAGVTALAGTELTLRSLSEAVPVFEVLGTVLTLLVPFVSDKEVIAWLVGWVFLATLSYQTYAKVDAIQGVADQSRVAARLGGTALTVAVGLTVKQRVIGLRMGNGSIPSPFAENVLFLLVGALVLAALLSGDRFGEDAVLATVLGAIMAIAASLYPLPEVAVIVWVVSMIGVNTVPFGPQLESLLNDPIERLMLGVAAAKSSLKGFLIALYVVAGLVLSLGLIIDSAGTTSENLVTLVQSIVAGRQDGEFATTSLTADAFLLLCVFTPAVYGVWYWTRVAERLPFAFDLAAASKPRTGHFTMSDATKNENRLDKRAIPPWYGAPIALAMAVLIVYVNAVDGGDEQFLIGYLVAVAAVAVVAAGTVVLTRMLDSKPKGGDVVKIAPRALALQLGIIGLAGSDPVPQIVHGVLTLNTAGLSIGGIGGAIGGALLLAGGFYLPSRIPLLLDANPLLGYGVTSFYFGLLGALFGVSDGLIEALGGLVAIVGILLAGLGIVAEIGYVLE